MQENPRVTRGVFLLHQFAKIEGRDAEVCFKAAGKMTLIGKAARGGNIRQRDRSFFKQIDRSFDLYFSGILAEITTEIPGKFA
jgi:hypothetical protein